MKYVFTFFLVIACFFSGAQIITTIAGSSTSGYSGDGGAATAARISNPWAVTGDTAGNLYIADYGNSAIRKVSASGIITSFAGTPTPYYSGDGGPASAASLNYPQDVLLAPDGAIYIADAGNDVVRKIDTAGIITTVAGNNTEGFSGDGGAATAAELDQPTGVAIDAAGNLYIADYNNYRIRKVDASGTISTVAGNGYGAGLSTGEYTGDGGPATAAGLFYPLGVAADDSGNIYIADYQNNAIRKVNASGIISTIAGDGIAGYTGDGGAATAAKLSGPSRVAMDVAGNIYISDGGNQRIRKINPSGIITTVIGNGTAGYSGDYDTATLAEVNHPEGIYIDHGGVIYVADEYNSRIRRVSASYAPLFIHGVSDTLTVCQNSFENSFNTLLPIRDSASSTTETWRVTVAPHHGSVLGFPVSLFYTSGVDTPSSVSYQPATGYTGADSLVVSVSDGFVSSGITIHINVISAPVAGAITGPSLICIPDTGVYTDPVPGGMWSTSSTDMAMTGIGHGIPINPSIDTIFYQVTNMCGTATASKGVTAAISPDPGVIVSPSYDLCIGDTVILYVTSISSVIDSGGVWTVSNSSAHIDPLLGTFTGLFADTLNVTFTNTNICGTGIATQSFTVSAAPAGSVITGAADLCEGYLLLLSDTIAGGVWYSANNTASISADGILEGLTGGRDTIFYALNTYCGSDTASKVIRIDSTPVAGAITGASLVCVGSTITLSDSVTGGDWSSANSRAAATGRGAIIGIYPGLDTISYIVSNSCGIETTSKTITVQGLSAGVITGSDTVCQSQTVTLTDSVAGGIWSSQETTIAGISSAGLVTGILPGNDSIFYSVTNMCGNVYASFELEVLSTEACNMEAVAKTLTGNSGLAVYPNPGSGDFTIKLNSPIDEGAEFSITDAKGVIIYSGQMRTNVPTNIVLATAPGIYVLNAAAGGKSYGTKLLIQ